MFRILIADDEKVIRKGIIAILTRDLGEELTFLEAANGLQAVELAQGQPLDLIISDISMPGLGGLEFIRKLREAGRDVPVIIISGYENFSFAKEAIRLGVREYVLKPVKREEFVTLVRECMSEIARSREESLKTVKRKRENGELLSQVRKEVLIQLLTESESGVIGQCLKRLEKFGISFGASLFACGVIEYTVTEANRDYIDFAAKNIADEYLGQGDGHALTVEYSPGRLAFILEFKEPTALEKTLRARISEAAGLIARYCKVRTAVGIGDIAYDPAFLNKSMGHALTAADFKIYGGVESVYLYGDMPRGTARALIPVQALLRELDGQSAVGAVNAFEPFIREPATVQSLECIRASYGAMGLVLEERRSRAGVPRDLWPSLPDFSEFWSFQEMKQALLRAVSAAGEALGDREEAVNRKLADEIAAYIREHITEEIDLNVVADHFSRTPGYVSTLFRKATDSGFNAFVTGERVKIAKKLLADSSIPIQRVGELCGYPNAKYFSVVFKKTTGENPKRYRENAEKSNKH